MHGNEIRVAWIATCVFWAWSWLIGSLAWVPFTFGLSLAGLLFAAGSVWAIWIPIGKPKHPHHPPAYAPPYQAPGAHGAPGYGYPATPPSGPHGPRS
ncbi:hypothetical protein [Streptomyces sp. NPDC000851]